MRNPLSLVSCFLLLLYTAGCAPRIVAPPEWEQVSLQGQTMGTTYSVKVVHPAGRVVDAEALQADIDGRLVAVNNLMSTYIPDSELARFNVHSSTEPFEVSRETMQVVLAAKSLFLSTQGAFDPTVGPLVELWGFGTQKGRTEPPSEEEIAQAKAAVGMDRLVLDATSSSLSKTHPGLRLDLSAIAKGYGSDAVSDLLKAKGLADHMVEIGGEITVAGKNLKRENWRLGIDSPLQPPGQREIIYTISLSDNGLATSGDYRIFFSYQGIHYAHILDPHTGWPVPESIKSASVIAPNCMLADGAATAIMALGGEKGIAWAESQPDLEAMVLIGSVSGELVEKRTSGFGAFVMPHP